MGAARGPAKKDRRGIIVLSVLFYLFTIFVFFSFPIIGLQTLNGWATLVDAELADRTMYFSGFLSGIGVLHFALAIGVIFTILKFIFRWAYGAIEVFFGTYGAGVSLSLLYLPEQTLNDLHLKSLAGSASPYTLFIGFCTSVYVIVRGFDNISAWIKDRVGKDQKRREKRHKDVDRIRHELERIR